MNHQDPTLPAIDPVEEELVAYLDEELEPEHRARVEHRLAADPRYRDQLRHMQKSWDMLDLLARSEPDEGFTRTTVAMVALKAREATDVQKESTQRLGLLFRVGVVVSTLACGLIAYSACSWLLSASDRQLVRELPLIEHLDEYKHAESVAFLKSLEGLFGQHYRQAAADAESVAFLRSMEEQGLIVPEAGEEAEPATAARDWETDEQRRDRLQKMTPEQTGAIFERQQRFAALNSSDQERLRTLAKEIDADPQGDKLKQVLTNYHEWLKSLGAKDQSEVLAAPVDQRITKIKEVQNRQATKRLKTVALELSSQDMGAITDWLDLYVSGHLAEFGQLTPPQLRAALEKLPVKDRIDRHRRGIAWRLGRKELLPQPTEQELDALVSVLSTKAQVVLEETESREQKWQYVQELIHQVQQSKRYPRLSDEDLRKFAATLKPEQREALENKTADEMKNALHDLYYSQKASPSGGFFPWPAGTFGPPARGQTPPGQPPRSVSPPGDPPPTKPPVDSSSRANGSQSRNEHFQATFY